MQQAWSKNIDKPLLNKFVDSWCHRLLTFIVKKSFEQTSFSIVSSTVKTFNAMLNLTIFGMALVFRTLLRQVTPSIKIDSTVAFTAGCRKFSQFCKNSALQSGMITDNDRHFTIESLTDSSSRHRPKREILDVAAEGDEKMEHLVVISETSASGGECGLQAKNRKRLKAPMLSQHSEDAIRTVKRIKRQGQEDSDNPPRQKAIEIAVFVDDDLYRKVKNKEAGKDPILAIQDLVFTYLHSVRNYPLLLI